MSALAVMALSATAQDFDNTPTLNINNKDKQAIMKGNGNKMYIRVGVTTNGKVNYSEVVPVDVSF